MEHTRYPLAKELLEKSLHGNCTPEETALLDTWYEHLDDDVQTVHMTDEESRALQLRFMKGFHAKITNRKIRRLSFLRAAATWIGILAIGGLAYQYAFRSKPLPPVYVTMHTGVREMRKITLPDHSVVWMNANTTLSYHEDFLHHRDIRLEGEALFEVAQDAGHPFTVRTPDSVKTLVLGTAFNISSYRQLPGTRISVLSGRVEVSGSAGTRNRLGKDEEIRYDRRTGAFEKRHEQAAVRGSWRTGEWILNNQGIEDLVLLMYNQFGVKVEYNTTLTNKKINANFNHRQSAGKIITVYCLLTQQRFRWKTPTIVEIY